MLEFWEPWRAEIEEVIERLSAFVPSQVVLAAAVGASILAGWWLLRKLVKLALYAAIAGAAAWIWYFGIPNWR